MNTNSNTSSITTRSTVRSACFAACLALLFAGATACGSEDGTSANSGRPQKVSSADLAKGAEANQAAYLQRLRAKAEAARRLRAEHADATRAAHGHADPSESHGYGDDRRQSQGQPGRQRTPSAHHSPGFDKALPGEW